MRPEEIFIRMQYVNLGSTGLQVSRICLGAMTYGSKRWREWVLEEEESRPFIRRAVELKVVSKIVIGSTAAPPVRPASRKHSSIIAGRDNTS